MAKLIVRHKLNDYDQWKSVYDATQDMVPKWGGGSMSVFRNVDDGNEVVVIGEFESVEKARGFMESDELKEAMKEAGVAERPDVTIVE